jgi:hypothetical protein
MRQFWGPEAEHAVVVLATPTPAAADDAGTCQTLDVRLLAKMKSARG